MLGEEGGEEEGGEGILILVRMHITSMHSEIVVCDHDDPYHVDTLDFVWNLHKVCQKKKYKNDSHKPIMTLIPPKNNPQAKFLIATNILEDFSCSGDFELVGEEECLLLARGGVYSLSGDTNFSLSSFSRFFSLLLENGSFRCRLVKEKSRSLSEGEVIVLL